jgi:hypothetical protein
VYARPVKRFGERAAELARAAPEPMVAVALGVLFTTLGLLHAIEGDTLSEVTLLVLAVLALAVVRDRAMREDVASAMRSLDQDVRGLLPNEPFHVLHYTSAMQVSDGGALAVGTRTKRIRFEQNSVLSISDLSESTGSNQDYACYPKPLKAVDHFSTGGKLHSLISLGRPWNRGEELEFTIQETITGAFVADREDVTVEIANPTDALVIAVTWAAGRAVDVVYVERGGKLMRVNDAELVRAPTGEMSFTRTFDAPQVGELVSVVWDWE